MNLASVPTSFEHMDPARHSHLTRNPNRLFIEDGWYFEQEMWVPAVRELLEASTVGECLTSLGNTALRFASFHDRYKLRRGSLVADPPGIELLARFRYTLADNGVIASGSMRSARVADLEVGVPTPADRSANAYAVVDKVEIYSDLKRLLNHEVFASPGAKLSDRLVEARRTVALEACQFLNSRSPAFELPDRLNDAGIEFDD